MTQIATGVAVGFVTNGVPGVNGVFWARGVTGGIAQTMNDGVAANIAASAIMGGVAAKAQGGRFIDGVKGALVSAGMQWIGSKVATSLPSGDGLGVWLDGGWDGTYEAAVSGLEGLTTIAAAGGYSSRDIAALRAKILGRFPKDFSQTEILIGLNKHVIRHGVRDMAGAVTSRVRQGINAGGYFNPGLAWLDLGLDGMELLVGGFSDGLSSSLALKGGGFYTELLIESTVRRFPFSDQLSRKMAVGIWRFNGSAFSDALQGGGS